MYNTLYGIVYVEMFTQCSFVNRYLWYIKRERERVFNWLLVQNCGWKVWKKLEVYSLIVLTSNKTMLPLSGLLALSILPFFAVKTTDAKKDTKSQMYFLKIMLFSLNIFILQTVKWFKCFNISMKVIELHLLLSSFPDVQRRKEDFIISVGPKS